MEHMISAAVIMVGFCAGVFYSLVKRQDAPKRAKVVVKPQQNHKKAA